MGRLLRIVDKVAERSAVVAGFLVGAMMIVISYEIIARYFFVRPTTWAYDVTEYLIVYATFMAAPWLLKNKSHVTVTIVTDHLFSSARLVLEVVTSVLGLTVSLVVCVEGAIEVWELFRDGVWVMRPFSIPKCITRLPIPFGGLLLAIYFIEIAGNSIAALRSRAKKEAKNS